MNNSQPQSKNLQRKMNQTHPQNPSILRTFLFVALPLTIFISGAIYAVIEGYSRANGAAYFATKEVIIATEGPAQKSDLIKLANIKLGANIFSVNLEKIKSNIEKNPWVASAVVTRALPNQIVIQYTPQEPVAIVNFNGLHYMNKDGKIFYRLNKNDSLQFPYITLEGEDSTSENIKTRLRVALQIFSWSEKSKIIQKKDIGDVSVKSSEQDTHPILATVAYPPSGAVKSVLGGKTNLKRRFLTASLNDENLEQQLNRAELVLQHLTQHAKNPRLIRLELGKKVVVKIAQ